MKYLILISLLFFGPTSFGQNQKNKSSETQFSSNEKNAIIGKPIPYRGIELAQFEFPNEMTFIQAQEACKKLGDGWRLPNWDEMNVIVDYSQKKHLYTESHIITGDLMKGETRVYAIVEIDATYYHPEGPFGVVGDDGHFDLDVHYVWPVRNIPK